MKLRVTIVCEMDVEAENYPGIQPVIYESEQAHTMGVCDYLEAIVRAKDVRHTRPSIMIEEVL